MADFLSGFWPLYITLLALGGLAFCLWIVLAQHRMKTDGQTTGHTWDEDLQESNNPLPRWWVFMFLGTIAFAVVYLLAYPGLGSFKGLLGWSSASRYESESEALNAQIEPIYAAFRGVPAEQLASDPKAMAIGEKLFLNNCAQCHGSDARGSRSFPNLTDADWLYGGTEEAITTTISKGRHGVMPPMTAAVGGATEVEQLAQYVLSLSGGETDAVKASQGKARFGACAACHGADGKGMQALGAPNLTDRIWLHGGGLRGVLHAINNGHNNIMPEHGSRFSPAQMHVLTGYVMSLSRAPAAGTTAGAMTSTR